jgi:hypothetical protein
MKKSVGPAAIHGTSAQAATPRAASSSAMRATA